MVLYYFQNGQACGGVQCSSPTVRSLKYGDYHVVKRSNKKSYTTTIVLFLDMLSQRILLFHGSIANLSKPDELGQL